MQCQNQFIAALNDAIRSGKLKILRHSKEMDFQEGTNQLIVKDKLLILEESAMENVLIPSMRTADNTCRILKCLKACEYLHATKKTAIRWWCIPTTEVCGLL